MLWRAEGMVAREEGGAELSCEKRDMETAPCAGEIASWLLLWAG